MKNRKTMFWLKLTVIFFNYVAADIWVWTEIKTSSWYRTFVELQSHHGRLESLDPLSFQISLIFLLRVTFMSCIHFQLVRPHLFLWEPSLPWDKIKKLKQLMKLVCLRWIGIVVRPMTLHSGQSHRCAVWCVVSRSCVFCQKNDLNFDLHL